MPLYSRICPYIHSYIHTFYVWLCSCIPIKHACKREWVHILYIYPRKEQECHTCLHNLIQASTRKCRSNARGRLIDRNADLYACVGVRVCICVCACVCMCRYNTRDDMREWIHSVCCSVLQYVAVCCRMLQRVAVWIQYVHVHVYTCIPAN